MTKSCFPNEYPCNGEIYYIVNDPLQPSIGTELWSNRCGIIVSNNTNNKNSGFVEIVYLSTSTHKRLSPTHIPVISGTKKAIAICEQVHTVDNSRLKTYIGKYYTRRNVRNQTCYPLRTRYQQRTLPTRNFQEMGKNILKHITLTKNSIH